MSPTSSQRENIPPILAAGETPGARAGPSARPSTVEGCAEIAIINAAASAPGPPGAARSPLACLTDGSHATATVRDPTTLAVPTAAGGGLVAEAHGAATAASNLADADVANLLLRMPLLASHFVVLDKVGEGTFSTVFKAHPVSRPDQPVALKRLYPTSSPRRVLNEIQCLRALNGAEGVTRVLACLRNFGEVILVLPYVEHERFQVRRRDARSARPRRSPSPLS